MQVDPSYKEKSGPLTEARGVAYCRDLVVPDADRLVQTRLLIVHQLAAQILSLDAEVADPTSELDRRVRESRTPLLALRGVGTVVAARLLGELVRRRASPRTARWRRCPASPRWPCPRVAMGATGSTAGAIAT